MGREVGGGFRMGNSRIPPQLEKIHMVPTSSQDEALARYGADAYVDVYIEHMYIHTDVRVSMCLHTHVCVCKGTEAGVCSRNAQCGWSKTSEAKSRQK